MEGPAANGGEGRGRGRRQGDIERLPEDCVARVLSFTSPRDVCGSSAVSKAFLCAAESDLVWDRLLPPDCGEILHRSSPPVAFSSKRELYFRLCDSILVDSGGKMLWLERATGKKCYMLSARALRIIWGNDTRYWRWISLPGARFPEVAELLDVCWLEITASISTRELSPGTRYGAYLVMRYSDHTYGLEYPPQETVVSVGGVQASTRKIRLHEQRLRVREEYRWGAPLNYPWFFPADEIDMVEEDQNIDMVEEEEEVPAIGTGSPYHPEAGGGHNTDESDASEDPSAVQVGQPSDRGEGVCVPRARGDGWMDLEMGDFFIEAGGEELVDVRLQGWQSLHWKSGLIVHGIEMRPMP